MLVRLAFYLSRWRDQLKTKTEEELNVGKTSADNWRRCRRQVKAPRDDLPWPPCRSRLAWGALVTLSMDVFFHCVKLCRLSDYKYASLRHVSISSVPQFCQSLLSVEPTWWPQRDKFWSKENCVLMVKHEFWCLGNGVFYDCFKKEKSGWGTGSVSKSVSTGSWTT